MKIKKYLLMGIVVLCSVSAVATPPQEVKRTQQKKVETQGQRPTRIQTSAKPEETAVLKSAEGKKKSEAVVEVQEVKKTKEPAKRAAKQPAAKEKGPRYITIKNNLAYQAIAVSNLAVEVQCSKHLSVELPLIWSFWDMEQEHGIRTFALQPEARWWTGNEVGRGHFFGVHAHVGWFNVKWNDNRYQSNDRPLLGAGISYGYKLPLGNHWGAEFSLGAGYANMRYDTYYNIDNGAKIDTRVRDYWGITRVGLSLVYRF